MQQVALAMSNKWIGVKMQLLVLVVLICMVGWMGLLSDK